MPILLDKHTLSLPREIRGHGTLGEALEWVQTQIASGRVLVKIQLDGQLLEGPAIDDSRNAPLGHGILSLTTADRKELSFTMLGKLAALIEWLAPQHKTVADLLESGEPQKALDRLSGILSAWHEIQSAYGNLAKLLEISLQELTVQGLTGEAVLDEFCHQLSEIQTALKSRDFVLLADILQYEMDGAVANWMALLESTLAIVEPPVGVA